VAADFNPSAAAEMERKVQQDVGENMTPLIG
jgi:hypothetical protein